MNKKIDENEFSPAVGGSNGTISYGQEYGTPNPTVSRNANHFASSDNNKAVNQNPNSNAVEKISKNSLKKDLNIIYSKKDTPKLDDFIAGIKYEERRQKNPNMTNIKQTVLDNLKKDPHFYSELHMLDIEDGDITKNMTEAKRHPNDRPASTKITVNVDETKKVFSEMAKAYDNRYVVKSEIVDVMNKMWKDKKKRNSWRGL